MSNSEFVKGACAHCAGHLEFPATAIGQSVPCPHCGQPTVLAVTTPANQGGKTNVSSKVWLVAGLSVCLVAAVLGGVFYWAHKAAPGGTAEAKPVSPIQSNTPAAAVVAPAPLPKPKPEAETNDFAIMPFKLENTPGSSLVYITGTVRNLSDQQRFGVKLTFSLFDANDNPVGSATDYQSVLAPHADWRFKALVMESKTASARFSSIAEDK